MEDEWLIVYILRELSRSFPQIWVRIVDTDGQFLLIEAANTLPTWLNPEIADYRVWLNHGKLLIIPIDQTGAKTAQITPKPEVLDLDGAIKCLRKNQLRTLHSPAIEAEAFYRLQKYPKHVSDSLHHARILIPRKLAYILHHDAAYISPAVEAFYLRDPIALRPLQAGDNRNLIFAPIDSVEVSTRFTRIGYAQLKSQSFDPPPAWVDRHIIDRNSKSQDMAVIGMKVACGFEMLLSDPQNQDKKAVREIKLLLEDLETGEDHLPSDTEINGWQMKEDDEKWLDINFEDFERELAGKAKKNTRGVQGGFGDPGAQEHLRKMVARFQDLLDDDAAGIDGAEFPDDMDNDDYEDGASSEDAEAPDEPDIEFNEEKFAKMMRELLGVAESPATAENNKRITKVNRMQSRGISSVSPDKGREEVEDEKEEENEILQNLHEFEQELREVGALDLGLEEPFNEFNMQHLLANGEINAQTPSDQHVDDADVDIDFNLARNLLESFKGQAGMPGPTGNLMGLMGLRLPQGDGLED